MGQTLTTQQAADKLGVSQSRVYALIRSGRLQAKRFGNVWMIDSADLKAVKDRPPGRPKKKR